MSDGLDYPRLQYLWNFTDIKFSIATLLDRNKRRVQRNYKLKNKDISLILESYYKLDSPIKFGA